MNEQSCPVEPEELSAFMDEELPDDRMNELREHVRTCDRCGERLSRLRETQRAVRTMDVPTPPESLLREVRERTGKRASGEDGSGAPSGDTTFRQASSSGASVGDPEEKSWFGRPAGLAAAAVLLVGILGGLIAVVQESSKSAKEMDPTRVAKKENTDASRDAAPTDTREETEDAASLSMPKTEEADRAESASSASGRERTEDRAGGGGTANQPEKLSEGVQEEQEDEAKRKKALTASVAEETEPDGEDRQVAAGGLKATGDSDVTGGSTILVRLNGDRTAVLTDVISALSVLRRDDATMKAMLADQSGETSGTGEEQNKTTDDSAAQRTVSVPVPPEREQLSELLSRNAELELTVREDGAKLFLAALVQQGRGPVVLSDGTETATDAKTTERLRSVLDSFQDFNTRLLRSRRDVERAAENAKARTSSSGDAVSLSDLKQYLVRSDTEQDGGPKDETAQKQARSAGGAGDRSTRRRRRILRKWIAHVENRAGTPSEEREKEALRRSDASGDRTYSRSAPGEEFQLNIRLRVRSSRTKEDASPELQQTSSPEDR